MRLLTQTSFKWPVRPTVQIDVMVRVPLDGPAYDGYSREQITALLEGIGKVIAASEGGRRAGAPPERAQPP